MLILWPLAELLTALALAFTAGAWMASDQTVDGDDWRPCLVMIGAIVMGLHAMVLAMDIGMGIR